MLVDVTTLDNDYTTNKFPSQDGVELYCSTAGGDARLTTARTEIEIPLGLDTNWRADHYCPPGKFLMSAQTLSQSYGGFFQGWKLLSCSHCQESSQ